MSAIKISNEILPYRKKNNIINLTATHLSKPNESIEANKILMRNINTWTKVDKTVIFLYRTLEV